MECLLTFCVYLAAGLGMQTGYEMGDAGHYNATRRKSNDYGLIVGRGSLIAERGLFYGEITHVSGASTAEADGGLNAALLGVKGYYNKLYVKAGAGIQVQASDENRTNEYGAIVTEVGAGVNFGDGMFIQGSVIDGMMFAIFGLSSHF